jgi:hypothetical protein
MIGQDIKRLKRKLWHGQVDTAYSALERIISDMNDLGQKDDFSAARLNTLGQQLLTCIRSNRNAMSITVQDIAPAKGLRQAWLSLRSILWLQSGWSKINKCADLKRALTLCGRSEPL